MSRRRTSRKSNYDPQGFFQHPVAYSQRKGQTLRPKSSNLSSDGVRPSASHLEASRQLLIDYHYFTGSHAFVLDLDFNLPITDSHTFMAGSGSSYTISFTMNNALDWTDFPVESAQLISKYNQFTQGRPIGIGSYVEVSCPTLHFDNPHLLDIPYTVQNVKLWSNSTGYTSNLHTFDYQYLSKAQGSMFIGKYVFSLTGDNPYRTIILSRYWYVPMVGDGYWTYGTDTYLNTLLPDSGAIASQITRDLNAIDYFCSHGSLAGSSLLNDSKIASIDTKFTQNTQEVTLDIRSFVHIHIHCIFA